MNIPYSARQFVSGLVLNIQNAVAFGRQNNAPSHEEGFMVFKGHAAKVPAGNRVVISCKNRRGANCQK